MSERITDRDEVGNVGRNDAGLFATPSRMLVKTVGEVELAEKSERLRGWVDPETSSTAHFAKRLFAECKGRLPHRKERESLKVNCPNLE